MAEESGEDKGEGADREGIEGVGVGCKLSGADVMVPAWKGRPDGDGDSQRGQRGQQLSDEQHAAERGQQLAERCSRREEDYYAAAQWW